MLLVSLELKEGLSPSRAASNAPLVAPSPLPTFHESSAIPDRRRLVGNEQAQRQPDLRPTTIESRQPTTLDLSSTNYGNQFEGILLQLAKDWPATPDRQRLVDDD
ncbi:hypothetical protein U1Q18_036574 [Sarracenia purpurea var. burkii]